MKYKEQLAIEREVKKNWEQLEKRRSDLCELLIGKLELQPFDAILLYQSINIVLDSLLLKEKQLKNSPNRIREKTVKDFNVTKKMKKEYGDVPAEIICFLISENEEISVAKRLEAIGEIRSVLWKTLYNQKDKLKELSDKFPYSLVEEDMELIFQCLSLIVLEFDIKDKEIEILEQSKFE